MKDKNKKIMEDLKYFNLTKKSTKNELRQSFLAKVKLYHPDTTTLPQNIAGELLQEAKEKYDELLGGNFLKDKKDSKQCHLAKAKDKQTEKGKDKQTEKGKSCKFHHFFIDYILPAIFFAISATLIFVITYF